jgi:hypothetical protein
VEVPGNYGLRFTTSPDLAPDVVEATLADLRGEGTVP